MSKNHPILNPTQRKIMSELPQASGMPDGGPAFPSCETIAGQIRYPTTGMSLRDYFAAAALTGLWACDVDANTFSEDAIRFYRMADAMLAARLNKP